MNGKRAQREAARPRLEGLEPRLLLSANTALDSLYVSSLWFEQVAATAAVDGGTQEGAAFSESVEQIEWRGQTLSVVADRWIVQFQPGSIEGISSPAETAGLLTADLVNFDVIGGLGMTGQVLIQTYGADATAVSNWLAGDPDVAYYEPDAVLEVQVMPNDPSFGTLWGLHNTGQSGGTVDVDIDAPEAWDITTGSSDVVIAVIDSGVDYTHVDLVANMWTNPGETPGDGEDNDGNGYIDDVYGWDWAYDDDDPMDGDGHGTHVSGTIGGVGDNATGVVGVNWTVKIMALKFLNDSGSGSTADAVSAVNYATMMKRDYGVNIVATNNSWGGGGASSSMSAAIEASGDEGILFLAAAGNGGADEIGDDNDVTPYYPATYDLDNIISVASITRTDARSVFSNYGAVSVDLAAPGSSIYSTLPGDSYGTYSGTSMATPHVSGVVGLMAALDPTASAGAIKSAIFSSVVPIPAMDGITATGGRLNAYAALQTLSIAGPRLQSISTAATTPPVDEITANFTEDLLGSSVVGANFLLRDDGADDAFDTGDDTIYAIGDSDLSQPQADTVTISLGSLLPAEQYRLTILGTGGNPIQDPEANPLNDGVDEVVLFEVITASGPYESNDDISEATDSGLTGAGEVTLSAHVGDGFYGAKDVDLFSVAVDEAATLIADIDAQSIGTSLDPMLRLFDAGGTALAINDDADGLDSYLRYDLPSAGTYYVGVTGWDNSTYDATTPNSGAGGSTGDYDLTLTIGAGSALLGEIHGTKWYDADGDGVWDGGEVTIGGWPIYLDLNNDGAHNPQSVDTIDSTDVPVAITDKDTVTSDAVVSGLSEDIADVNVTLDITHTYDGDLVLTLISPIGTRVELADGIGGSGNDFDGTTFDDEAGQDIGDGTAPFGGTYRPGGSLSDFDGESANGTWQLEIVDEVNGDEGTLNSWSLTIVTGEPTTTTVFDGTYLFTDLPAGTYTVAESDISGWEQKYPAGGTHSVTLAEGEVVEDVDFGNDLAEPPVVTAVVLNGDRTVSDIEPSGTGVQTVEVTFSEDVNFTSGDVTVQEVTFSGNTETLGDVLTPTSITGSGTDTMTITFDIASVVDTWVKVTLDGGATIEDLAGNALDGEPDAGGSGRGYVYDATDLPTGNGTAGGDAVFYVGSLRGDLYGGDLFEPDPNGELTDLDVAGFIAAYQGADLDADFYGGDLFDPIPDGNLDDLDVAGFISAYQAGASLDPLPTLLGGASVTGSAALSVESPASAETFDAAPLPTTEPTESADAEEEARPVREARRGPRLRRPRRVRRVTRRRQRSRAAEREVLDKALADAEADGEAGNGGVDLLAMVDSLTLLPRR